MHDRISVRTDTTLVHHSHESRVFLDVISVLHHHAKAVVAGPSEDLETFVTATRESPIVWTTVCAVFPGASVLLTTIDILPAFVDSC